MTVTVARGARAWLARRAAPLLLVVTAAGTAAGGVAWLAGAGRTADVVWLGVAICGLAYACWVAVASIAHGRLSVDVIALLALAGAIAVDELLAAAVISVMLASGRALEDWAAYRARHDLSALLARAPRTARRYRDGSLETVPLDQVVAGDLLLVAAGDVVPVDGTLAAGAAVLDESALTGEALPVQHGRGDALRSGTVNAAGPFDLRATTSAADSTYAGIVRLVSEAENAQAPFVRLADRYAMWFLPLSLAVAGVAWALGGPARAVAVLVVATPCPLILAAPVALVSGLSAAARRGIVVKNGGVLERLARCTTVLLDKTGTLTAGQPAVTAVVPAGAALAPEEILGLAASLDQASGHVLATAVVRAAAERGCPLGQPADVTERAGQGIEGTVAGRLVRLGRAEWAGVQRHSAVGQGRPQAGLAGRRAHRVRRRRRNPRGRAAARGPDPAGRPADDQGAAPRRHHPDRARHRRPGRGGQRRRRADRGRRGAGGADAGRPSWTRCAGSSGARPSS